jgi:hypothetical protein
MPGKKLTQKIKNYKKTNLKKTKKHDHHININGIQKETASTTLTLEGHDVQLGRSHPANTYQSAGVRATWYSNSTPWSHVDVVDFLDNSKAQPSEALQAVPHGKRRKQRQNQQYAQHGRSPRASCC